MNKVKLLWKQKNLCNFATWNVRGINYTQHELGSILNGSNIKIAAITETKKTLKETTESQNYIIIYSGVDRNIHAQAGVMIWCHKSIKVRSSIINSGMKEY
jgi:exonuclease III